MLWLLMGLLQSCHQAPEAQKEKVLAYQPIYEKYENIKKVEVQGPRVLKKPGKIYIKDNLLYINELGLGVHVFDNTDKSKPVALAFISIPANQDISIKDKFLYADNGEDLLAIDISSGKNAKVLKRIEKSFPYPYTPPMRGVKFECPDPAKGYIVDWKLIEMSEPNCFN
jgi:hypothetical protein